MESKVLSSVLRTTEVTRNQTDEMPAGDRKKKTEEGYGNKEVALKRNYDAISKNGDTLELSEKGKKMSDNILIGCSEAKLKQLYANKEITKQQYDRIIKKKNVKTDHISG